MSHRYEPSSPFDSFHNHADFSVKTDRDALKAPRPIRRPLSKRVVTVGTTRMVAFDAHRLLELVSESEPSRPGHPCG